MRSLASGPARRITKEHRLVYRSEAGVIFIAQCRFHYDK
jgi:Txe/YoeB family toxin of Txe-Axe toxin-antitoxin module